LLKKINFSIDPTSVNKNPKIPDKVQKMKENVKNQYEESQQYLGIEFNDTNVYEIEKVLLATEDLINNCIEDTEYRTIRDDNYSNLTFVYHSLSLKLERYKINKEIEDINKKNNELKEQQGKIEDQSNNLIYNLLSFLASFSIVSGVVGAVANIESTLNIMIFMTFSLLIVITTLIGLHNFYKQPNSKSKLHSNYFLWGLLLVIVIILMIISGVRYLIDNKEKFYSDDKMNQIIENKLIEENLIINNQGN
jgi:cation transport ATPase